MNAETLLKSAKLMAWLAKRCTNDLALMEGEHDDTKCVDFTMKETRMLIAWLPFAEQALNDFAEILQDTDGFIGARASA